MIAHALTHTHTHTHNTHTHTHTHIHVNALASLMPTCTTVVQRSFLDKVEPHCKWLVTEDKKTMTDRQMTDTH